MSKRQRPKVDDYVDDGYLFGVLHFPAYDKNVQRLNAGELDFFLGDGALRETLEDAQQRVARGLERSALPEVRAEVGEAGLALLALGAENGAREARFDERLVQPP